MILAVLVVGAVAFVLAERNALFEHSAAQSISTPVVTVQLFKNETEIQWLDEMVPATMVAITESISRSSSIAVISPGAALNFSRMGFKDEDMPQILGVSHFVGGTFKQIGDQINLLLFFKRGKFAAIGFSARISHYSRDVVCTE